MCEVERSNFQVHFPFSTHFHTCSPATLMHNCSVLLPAGRTKKQLTHTHTHTSPAHTPPPHTVTVARTKAKPRQTRPCGRPYRRGSVYNLRFMSAMLTVREKRWERSGQWDGQATVTRAVHRLMRLTNTYAHTLTHSLTRTHTQLSTQRNLHNVSNVIYVSR